MFCRECRSAVRSSSSHPKATGDQKASNSEEGGGRVRACVVELPAVSALRDTSF
jgi:hypothetical protein